MAGAAALKATVIGRVQGVFFRAFVAGHARDLGLTGYVRNLPDGSVEVLAEGAPEMLEELLEYLHEGPPAARVERVAVAWPEYSGDYRSFSISY